MAIENRDNLGLIDGQTVFGVRLQSLAKSTLGNGVLADTVASTALKVSERGAGADMSVDVAAGSCQINLSTYTEAGVTNIVITAAHATEERIDLIVYDQSASTAVVVTGTSHATNPQVPDVADDNDIPLALVYVLPQDDVAYSGTITNAYITDVRSFASTMASGNMRGVIDLPLYYNDDDTYGSNFTTQNTTAQICGKLKMTIPGMYPSATKTVTAKFMAIMSRSGPDAQKQANIELYNSTNSAQAALLSTVLADDNGENFMKVSTSLTVGTGNTIETGDVYHLRAYVDSAEAAYTCKVFKAWLEFYWG